METSDFVQDLDFSNSCPGYQQIIPKRSDEVLKLTRRYNKVKYEEYGLLRCNSGLRFVMVDIKSALA